MGTKRRLYQVAKEFDVSNDTLIHYLAKLNFDIRNHMSPVSNEMYGAISKKYGETVTDSGNEHDFRRRLKEKKVKEAAKQIDAQRKLEQRLKAATQFITDKSSNRLQPESAPDAHASVEAYIQEKKKPTARQSIPEVSKKEKFSAIADQARIGETPGSDSGDTLKAKSSPEKKQAIVDAKKIDSREIDRKAPESAKHKQKSTPKTSTGQDSDSTTQTKNRDKSISEQRKTKRRDHREKTTDDARNKQTRTAKKQTDQRGQPLESKTHQRKDSDKAAVVSAKPPFQRKESIEKSNADAGSSAKKRRRRRKKPDLKDESQSPGQRHPKDQKKETGKTDTRSQKDKETSGKKRDEVKSVAKDKKGKIRDRFKKKKKKKKVQISEAEVEKSIKNTLAIMEGASRGRKKRRKLHDGGDDGLMEGDESIIRVNEFISIGELANAMEIEANEVIKKCLALGLLVSINQRIDKDVIEMVADEFEYQVEILPEYGQDLIEELEDETEDEASLQARPPVVTIMGHVDHGKTSLLDNIRESNIIAGESGGITQHIGAYEVDVNGKAITFLDTPGHEAFTAMRARGVQITDLVILIVAADDAVMPQTIEAISHAQAAEVPIIVAINKIDKANANIELIKKQLADHNLLIEDWGGRYQCSEISAKIGTGIPKLLEMILVEAEMLELRANYDRLPQGVVIESRLDKGKGVVATILVQKGTLRVGAPFIVGQYFGKVRSLYNERNQRVKQVYPSVPVQVVGFSGMPSAGDAFTVLKSEKDTREISLHRQQIKREQELRKTKHLTLDEISKRIKQGGVQELNTIVKGDVGGSVEALADSLIKLTNDEVAVKVIHKGVGAVSESDVMLASASSAIIIGFHVRPTLQAREAAKRESVDVRMYNVIYDAISEVKDALEGMLEPEASEDVRGTIEVRQIFRVPKVGVIAGCHVLSGRVARNDLAKLYRDDKLIYSGRIGSLRRFKEDTKEVSAGFECGVGFDGFQDLKINDIIEPYKIVHVKRTLAMI